MMPLISSQVSSSEGTWWLLDSGAATSVLSQNYEGMYRCQAQEDSAGALETYYAANGTPVHMRANVLVSLAFQVVTGASGKKKIQSFKLACCIGDVSHNIISTTQLVKKGWSVIQSPGETYLYHEDSGTLISDVLLWGGTPWLRACRAAQPSLKDGSQPMELVESSVVEPEGLKVGMVGAVELSSQEKLRQHVLRGHYPFDPHCLECQQGRGVSRAPRRSLRERILEVQVDFFFLGLVESKFKMILLRQVFSGLLGVTAVSENVQVTGQHLRQILAEFGLLETLEGPPVDFRTDAQDEVGTVLRRSGLPREYTVNKAGPQNHDTVGSVERGVREVKEALAVLRLELAKAGLDLVDSLVAWEAASRYVTAMHNLHGKIQNTGKTGKELLRNTSEGTRISAMFCSRVLAETPEKCWQYWTVCHCCVFVSCQELVCSFCLCKNCWWTEVFPSQEFEACFSDWVSTRSHWTFCLSLRFRWSSIACWSGTHWDFARGFCTTSRSGAASTALGLRSWTNWRMQFVCHSTRSAFQEVLWALLELDP